MTNQSSREVDVTWINFEGDAVDYPSLAPGSHGSQPSYLRHLWALYDESDQCVAAFRAPADVTIIDR